jgi:hypothetical protein
MVDYEQFKKSAGAGKGTKTYISFDGSVEADAETYKQIMALRGQYDLKGVVAVSIAKLHEAVTKK